MISIPQIQVNDWKKLVEIADKLNIGDGLQDIYYFRGQEDADWGLKSSLHRSVTSEGRTPLPANDELLRVENILTEKFQGVASNYLPLATLSKTTSVIDWWPLMRHYGVPTRLIDWTASFYVALYFAVARLPDKDGALYLIHAYTLKNAMKGVHGNAEIPSKVTEADSKFQQADAPSIVYLYSRKTALLDRMIAQQGIFMVSANVGASCEEILAVEIPKVADSSQETLRKIRIKASEKPNIMKKLKSMNVTAGSLFPGLDGIGRQLDDLARNR